MNALTHRRFSGVLMHLSSLPSPYGIGTLGQEAYEFVDILKASHVKVWQMLPLSVTSYGDSPYQSPSSRGLNYYFIDLRVLTEKGLLKQEEYQHLDFGNDPLHVDYGKMFTVRLPLLKKAFSRFDFHDPSFKAFEKKGDYRDFAFYMTLKEMNSFSAWYTWPKEYRNYTKELEEKILQERPITYLFYVWTQFEFLSEFHQLKSYCHQNGISLMGDMPIYLSLDSVEAYKYPDLFQFDEKHNPTVVAGVPPDYFSKDGQLWGNPLYDWENMKKDGYSWFSDRIKRNLELFDLLRIDHFRAFADYYAIPYGRENARVGKWMKGPGMDLFRDKRELPIIAEDLGDIDDLVRKLLKDSGYPGMKVLEFAFDGKEKNEHLPSNSTANSVCYTGTHDNMPLLGYLEGLTKEELETLKTGLKKQCKEFLVDFQDESLVDLVRTMDTLCLASNSNGAILPLQDILVQGKESRMNTPSSTGNNWTYRIHKGQFDDKAQEFLKENIEKYHR